MSRHYMNDEEKNYWQDEACARAFWDQHLALPYQELLRDTAAWLAPQPGERWLDLGCGGGQLTDLLWRLSGGRLAEIVSLLQPRQHRGHRPAANAPAGTYRRADSLCDRELQRRPAAVR